MATESLHTFRMAWDRAHRHDPGRATDVFVGILAVVATVVAVGSVTTGGVPADVGMWAVTVGGMAVLETLDVIPFRGRVLYSMSLVEAPVVFGAATLSGDDARTAIVAGAVLVALLCPRCLHKALFAGANCLLAGTAAVAVASGPVDMTEPSGAARLVLVALAFGLTSWLLTTVAYVVGARTSVRDTLRAVPLLVAHTALATTLGVLAAALASTPWLLPLLLVPVAAVIAVGHVADTARLEQQRGDALLEAARSAASDADLESIVDDLVLAAGRVTGSTVRLAVEPATAPARSTPLPAVFAPMRHLVIDQGLQHPLRGEPDPTPALTTLVAVAGAAAENAALRHRLRQQAMTDDLTGLANRRLFNARLETAASRARRGWSFAVLFVDLDSFKQINDTFEHDAGDQVLREVAERMRRAVRANDEVFRLGGDEFTVIVDGVGDEESLDKVAEAIGNAVAGPVQHQGRTIDVTASVGGAFWTDETSPWDLLRAADARMYAAKVARRSAARWTDPPGPVAPSQSPRSPRT